MAEDISNKDIANLVYQLKKILKSDKVDSASKRRINVILQKLDKDHAEASASLNEFSKSSNKASRAAEGLEKAFGNINEKHEQYQNTLNKVNDRISFFTEGFGRNLVNLIGGSLGGAIMAALQQQTSMYRELVDVGQTFSGSLLNMNKAAFTAGLTLDQFSNLVKMASESAALLGMARFADLSKSVRSALLNFGSFGMSIQEVNESFANYVESQRISGTIQKFTNQELQQGFQSLAENAAFYAQLTGKSARELRSATIDVRNNALGFQAFLQTLPREMQSNVQTQFDSVTTGLVAVFGEAGRRLSQELGDSLAFGSAAFSETARMLTMISPQVGSSLQELVEANRRGTLTEQRRTEIMSKVVQNLGNLGPETMQYLAMLQNHPAHREFATQIIQMANAARAQREMTEEQRDVQRRREDLQRRFDNTTQQLLNQQQEFQLATAQFKLLFVNIINPLFTLLGPALQAVNEGLRWLGEQINGIMSYFGETGSMVVSFGAAILLLFKPLAALTAALLKAAAAAVAFTRGSFAGGFGGALGGLTGGFGSALGRGARAATGAAGSAAGGFGSALGRSARAATGAAGSAAGVFGKATVLGTMATGIMAAAKPIAVITLALMGLGKALEWAGNGVKSMSDGFVKLGEVNADGLWEFTKAALALAPALAGAGLGSMIGGLASSLGNLFGGGGAQISLFERLAAVGPGLSAVASALDTMQKLDFSNSAVQLDQMASAMERMNRAMPAIPDIRLPAERETTPSPLGPSHDIYQLTLSINAVTNRLEELIDLTRSGNVTRDDLLTSVRRMR